MPHWILFLYLWLTIGFVGGTLTLMGPVRWIADLARAQAWSEAFENRLVKAIIFLLILTTALLARWLTKWILSRQGPLRIGIPIAAFLLAAGTLWFWMNPASGLHGLGREISVGTHFTFGPYPTRERLARLKQDGYTAVVSLLHPAIVPFEPKLIEEEREEAKEIGINFLNFPMLPWISRNEESLQKIQELAASNTGRYYVHCYLGKDRIFVVKRLVELVGASTRADGVKRRDFSEIQAFERGKIYRLEKGVTFIPYPNEEELSNFILNGSVKVVVSLMSADQKEKADQIENEGEILSRYRMPLVSIPIPKDASGAPDLQGISEAVQKVRRLPRPLVVHEFTSDSAVSQAFLKAYQR